MTIPVKKKLVICQLVKYPHIIDKLLVIDQLITYPHIINKLLVIGNSIFTYQLYHFSSPLSRRRVVLVELQTGEFPGQSGWVASSHPVVHRQIAPSSYTLF